MATIGTLEARKSVIDRIRGKSYQIKANSLRRARSLLPYPRLWARLAGARIPTSYITGEETKLKRPEGFAFSPSGDLMVVSNSHAHSVIIYAKENSSEKDFGIRPSRTISDYDYLNFVHDVVFSPCGKYVAAVGREAHSLSIFAIRDQNLKDIEAKLIWSAHGKEYELSFPAGVAIHPSGKWLAVANRKRTGITLYRNSGLDGQFDSIPFQIITDEDLSIHDLAAPHGLDFSPDGKSLIVAHGRFFKTKDPKGESGLAIFKCRNDPNLGLDPHPKFIFPYGQSPLHSVAFHPSGGLVAVTNSEAEVDVFDWLPEHKTMKKRDSISFFRIGQGPKGVAFTRDGDQIAVTTVLNEVLFFDVVARRG